MDYYCTINMYTDFLFSESGNTFQDVVKSSRLYVNVSSISHYGRNIIPIIQLIFFIMTGDIFLYHRNNVFIYLPSYE